MMRLQEYAACEALGIPDGSPEKTRAERRAKRAVAKIEALEKEILARHPRTIEDVIVQLAAAGTVALEAVELEAQGDEAGTVKCFETIDRVLDSAFTIVAKAAKFDLRNIGMKALSAPSA